MKIETTTNKLKWAIYEALNNLDFAMSNDEIEEVQNGVFKELNIKHTVNWRDEN